MGTRLWDKLGTSGLGPIKLVYYNYGRNIWEKSKISCNLAHVRKSLISGF